MKGYIKISANSVGEDGMKLEVECDMTHVSVVDEVYLLDAFCKALDIDNAAILTMMVMREEIGNTQTKITVDTSTLKRFAGGADE